MTWSTVEAEARAMIERLDDRAPNWRSYGLLRTAAWLAAAVEEIDRLRAEIHAEGGAVTERIAVPRQVLQDVLYRTRSAYERLEGWPPSPLQVRMAREELVDLQAWLQEQLIAASQKKEAP